MWRNESHDVCAPAELAERAHGREPSDAEWKIARDAAISDLMVGCKVCGVHARDIFDGYLNEAADHLHYRKCLDILTCVTSDPYQASMWAQDLITEFVDEHEYIIADVAEELSK